MTELTDCWICNKNGPPLTEMVDRADELCDRHRRAFDAICKSLRSGRLSK